MTGPAMKMPMTIISPPIQSLLDLFTTSLADVRFADLDGKSLASCAAEVEVASLSVVTAQLAVDAARAALQEKQEALLQRAQQALAYARVYAEADLALARQLDAISLPRSTRRPRLEDPLVLSAEPSLEEEPRGRPRKTRVIAGAQPTLASIVPAE